MIYIDTGPFLARHVAVDRHHEVARKAWDELRRRGWRCFTSSFVLDETLTLLARSTSYAFAVERAHNMLQSRLLEILHPGATDELRALELFEKHADRRVSFTDCISFVLMRSARLKRAFTFDVRFRHAGFQVWPG